MFKSSYFAAFYSLIRKNFVKTAYNGSLASTKCVDFTKFFKKKRKKNLWEWFFAISPSSNNAVFYATKILREINFEALKTDTLIILAALWNPLKPKFKASKIVKMATFNLLKSAKFDFT